MIKRHAKLWDQDLGFQWSFPEVFPYPFTPFQGKLWLPLFLKIHFLVRRHFSNVDIDWTLIWIGIFLIIRRHDWSRSTRFSLCFWFDLIFQIFLDSFKHIFRWDGFFGSWLQEIFEFGISLINFESTFHRFIQFLKQIFSWDWVSDTWLEELCKLGASGEIFAIVVLDFLHELFKSMWLVLRLRLPELHFLGIVFFPESITDLLQF